MEVQVRDTIITDEYSVMTKTDDFKKIAKKVAESPNGVVIVKGRNSKVLGVVTYKEVIDLSLSKKDTSKLKFNDVVQTNIMTIKDTDKVDRVIKRMKRRKPIAAVVVNNKGHLVGYFSKSDMSYAEACQNVVSNMFK